jgi:hypothetical protein
VALGRFCILKLDVLERATVQERKSLAGRTLRRVWIMPNVMEVDFSLQKSLACRRKSLGINESGCLTGIILHCRWFIAFQNCQRMSGYWMLDIDLRRDKAGLANS